jgi:hypothetical protein
MFEHDESLRADSFSFEEIENPEVEWLERWIEGADLPGDAVPRRATVDPLPQGSQMRESPCYYSNKHETYACIFVHRANRICNYWNNCCTSTTSR